MSWICDFKNDEHCCWLCCPRCSSCYPDEETNETAQNVANNKNSPVTSQPSKKTTDLNKNLPGKEESTDVPPPGLRGPML